MMETWLLGAKLLLDGALVPDLAVGICGGTIAAVLPAARIPAGAVRRDLDGGILAPGFIDLQVNGGGGVLFNDAPCVDSLVAIGEAHRRHGTTGFLPTVITDSFETIAQALRAVAQAMAAGVPGVLGIHVEGPMLSPGRHGIHDPRFLSQASEHLIELLASNPCGRMLVTLAPEVVGERVIARLTQGGVIVAAGHTDATFDQMRAGFAAGITGVTHLFNGMSPLAHRAPGAIGAALDDQDVWCGLIVDGIHVHPASLRIAMRSRPAERFFLVTDAMPPAGTDLAEFTLQGRTMTVTDGCCFGADGTLAGSALTMDLAVRNLVELVGQPVATALGLAARSPAEFMGISGQRGEIAAGKAADLVWLDDALQVQATWIAGQEREGNGK